MGEILDSLQALYDFFISGSYNFVQEIFAELLLWVGVIWLKFKIASIGFFWGVAQAMLDQLNISGFIQDAWGGLDSNVLAFFTRYSVPEALNIIIGAKLTSFLMRLF